MMGFGEEELCVREAATSNDKPILDSTTDRARNIIIRCSEFSGEAVMIVIRAISSKNSSLISIIRMWFRHQVSDIVRSSNAVFM